MSGVRDESLRRTALRLGLGAAAAHRDHCYHRAGKQAESTHKANNENETGVKVAKAQANTGLPSQQQLQLDQSQNRNTVVCEAFKQAPMFACGCHLPLMSNAKRARVTVGRRVSAVHGAGWARVCAPSSIDLTLLFVVLRARARVVVL